MAKKKQNLLKITQVKSAIGYKLKAKKTLAALGLRRMHQTVVKPDTPVIRGMIAVVDYLVNVEEVS
ncbi:MAG: 50S ribosomal protein L30 [Candidatus Marinimicrobia bacterium]|nr:50S ribosomal protein L30 [Candidatus Neomarinimicrobiota bacterium]MBL7046370.1 50S ribosomal protein L30 [Candidatus Neomarinimicrobiota bacterium]